MHRSHRRSTACLSAVAAIAALSLSACGGSEESAPSSASDTTSASASVEPTQSPTESPTESESAATQDAGTTDGATPSWAVPVTKNGDLLTTVEVGDLSVEVYQVGTATADDTGSFVDPDTNKPLIEVGDTVVFVNYVVTNNGDPVDLGASLVSIDARYDDWPYLQGMDGLSSSDLYDAQGLADSGIGPDGYSEDNVYTLGGGQTFAFAENFEYQPGSELEIGVDYTPVDAQGELLSDERVEGEGTGTIA